jgi:RNA polymerase sigma-70 factor (ECF subfamily)
VEAISTEQVWRALHANIHAFVRRRVRHPADADDIVQRVFLQVHRSLPTLRSADALHAWIYQTARRVIVDHHRAAVNRREEPAGSTVDGALADRAGAADVQADDASALRELAGCLEPLVATLAERDREALRLVEVDGMSQVDAARRLGLSPSGMKSRVQRARARLRAAVELCCQVELDRRGGLLAYQARDDGPCGTCQ